MSNKEVPKMLKVYETDQRRVKILAVSAGITIPEMLRKIVDYYEEAKRE